MSLADLVTPMAIRVTVTLRIADHIERGDDTLTLLASAANAHPRMLKRLLDHLCFLDLMRISNAGNYQLTRSGKSLTRLNDRIGVTKPLDLDSLAGDLDMAITGLLWAVRTGETVSHGVFGKTVWEYLDTSGHSEELFRTFMADARVPELEFLVGGYDWGRFKHIVDVGGNVGTVLEALLERYTDTHATLVDLACFTARARSRLDHFGGRCRIHTQSFFDPLPSGGDVYLLSAILGDWPDEQAIRILANCGLAAGATGRVVVSELHLSGERVDSSNPTRTDLYLAAAMPEPNRAPEEISALATAAGLEQVAQTTSCFRSIIEFRVGCSAK